MSNIVAQTPPLGTLLAFDAAGRLGSFSAAADELGLTQSAISQQIKRLEEHAGQKLFQRRGTGVRLTAAGQLLHGTVRSGLEQLGAGFERIRPYRNQESVLLVCPADIAQGWLVPRLDELRRRRPSMEVWVITRQAAREIDRIDVDLIVSRRPIHTADVESVPLLEDEAIAVCDARQAPRLRRLGYPEVLERAPLLVHEDEPEWGGLLESRALRRRRLSRAATVDDGALLLAAVERGLGIGYVSRVAADAALRAGRVAALPAVPASPRERLWLMRTRLKPRTPVADAAFGWLRELGTRP